MGNILALPSSAKTDMALAENESREMGAQLTEQFDKATGGMREVLIFGAMMMHLRASIVSARGQVATGGTDSKDSGIKAWLGKYAPNVNRATAYRLEAVTASIADKWDGLPETLARKIEFPDLVTLPEPRLAKIDRRLPKKRKELFEYVKGTSQRSWLDQFVNTRRGGNQYDRSGDKGKRHPFSLPLFRRAYRDRAMAAGEACRDTLAGETFYALAPRELAVVFGVVEKLRAALLDFSRKTEAEREIIFQEAAVKFVKKYGAK